MVRTRRNEEWRNAVNKGKNTFTKKRRTKKRQNPTFEAELEIQDIGQHGDGIAFHEKQPVYINRSITGDYVKAKIEKTTDGTLRGEITQIITPSPKRVTPPCPHYDTCGGCTLQHIDQDTYQAWKNSLITEALNRRDITPMEVKPTIFIKEQTRRRSTLALHKTAQNLFIGYHQRRSTNITNITECLINDNKLLITVNNIKPYVQKIIKTGKSADLFIQLIDGQIDILITGICNSKTGEPDMNTRLITAEMTENHSIARISWRKNEKHTAEILIERVNVFKKSGEIDVPLPPGAFLQPSNEGEAALVNSMMQFLPKKGPFADLFSGSGTFSGHMLKNGAVDAFDNQGDAIDRLQSATKQNPKIRAITRDLYSDPLIPKELDKYSAVLLDPPRAGAKDQCKELINSKVPCIIYISCNPSAFAKDAQILTDEGDYQLQSIQAVDQFIYSHHIEVIGFFTKK